MKSRLDFLPFGALALLFLVVIHYGQLRIGLIALLLVLGGIATLHLLGLLRPAEGQYRSLRHPTYMAVGLGSVIILVWTGLLKALGLYSFGGMIVVLCGYVLLALAWRRPPSEVLSVREATANPWCLRYLCSVLLVVLLLPPPEYPDMAASAVYLTQGFDLFLDKKDPAEWPYFGEIIRMPLMYVTHNIGATFALFSNGDPNDYYLRGQYVLNILTAPLVPIGAYMFFARRLPWWAAALAAYGFCWSILAWKITSPRGETLGWILGFAFLLALEDLYANAGQLPSKMRAPARTGVVLALLYFGLALTHGVVAMIVTFLAIGITTARLIAEQNRLSLISDACKAGAAAAVVLCLLVPGYVYSFSPNLSLQELIHNDDAAPIAGEEDPALLLENAVSYPEPIDITPVHASPPFIDPLDVAQIGAFLPPASLFHARLARISISEFPHNALEALSQISLWERAAYALLGLFSCLLYLSPARSRRLRFGTVVYAAAATYLLLIAFGIYLDYVSVSIFPLAASRRTYVYGAAFFWIAVGTTFLDLALAGIKYRVPNYLAQASRRYLAPVCLSIFVPWLLVAILALQAGADSESQWIRERLISRLSGGDSQLASDGASYRALAEATNFIRENTRGGDWIVSNIVSDNQFWFLTHGRYSGLEGSVMYQVHSIQRRAVDRMMGVYKLIEEGDATLPDQHDIKYIALYKYCRCRTRACFGYNVIPARMSLFENSHLFTTAFENGEFLILQRDQSVPLHEILNRSVKANVPGDCFDPSPRPRGEAWAHGIDFSKLGYPQFVQEVKGVGNIEPWGRWTVDDEAVFHFYGPLPRRFVLKLKMDAFGPNVDQPVTVTVGRTTKSFKISKSGERFNLEFDLPQVEDTIRFRVPQPTRPHDLDPRQWEDTRRIGLGFMELKVDDWYYADAEPYSVTFAEGADFSRPGLPGFLVEASGLGPQNSWGRKIVGDKAVFRFWEPLQKRFHLLFTMKALGSAEVPIIVTAGPIEKAIKVKAESEQFDLTFALPETSDTISFKVGGGSRRASEPDGDVAIADLKLNF